MTLGEKIQSLRKSNNKTQDELAEVLGVSRQAVSKWEGGTSKPDIDKVAFTVVGQTCVLPDQFSTTYESVIIFGRAIEICGDEKNKALLEFINKYSPDFMKQGKEYMDKAGKATRVIKISIKHISGKAKK